MQPIDPVPEPEPIQPPAPTMSLGGRLLNVFAAPGDVFTEVRTSAASAANWLVPILLAAVVGVISNLVIFSQPGVQQSLHEQQVRALDRRVQQGKMTRAQEDQALQMAEKFSGPTMLAIFTSLVAVVHSVITVFWWALLLWLFGRWFLRARFPYLKAAEVAGLASVIAILGMVLTALLTASLGRLNATPSLALLVNDFDPTRRTHLLLGAVNLTNFWHVGVLAVGLAKLSGASMARAGAIVIGYWVLAELLLIAVGGGLGALAL